MLKRLDRIRFRGQRRDDLLEPSDSPNGSDTEGSEDVLKTRISVRETEELRDVEVEPQSEIQAGPGSMSAVLQDDPRTDINEVKGHLEVALLEKLFLQEELRKLKEESNLDSLRLELEKERSRRLDLEHRFNQSLRSRLEDSPSQIPQAPPPANPGVSSPETQKENLSSSFMKWLYERCSIYIEDFRFQPEETTVETEEPLSAKRLTENMRRLKRSFRPVSSFTRNLSALSSWSSVYTSSIAFLVYMYTAWHGWTVPMFLFLAILRLSLNYLISRSNSEN